MQFIFHCTMLKLRYLKKFKKTLSSKTNYHNKCKP
uniref:Uncharacterized protein n=1 Tax=Anguilla anguilla TaxID=7936 RepID=A0A0E9PCY8_ANGAN